MRRALRAVAEVSHAVRGGLSSRWRTNDREAVEKHRRRVGALREDEREQGDGHEGQERVVHKKLGELASCAPAHGAHQSAATPVTREAKREGRGEPPRACWRRARTLMTTAASMERNTWQLSVPLSVLRWRGRPFTLRGRTMRRSCRERACCRASAAIMPAMMTHTIAKTISSCTAGRAVVCECGATCACGGDGCAGQAPRSIAYDAMPEGAHHQGECLHHDLHEEALVEAGWSVAESGDFLL